MSVNIRKANTKKEKAKLRKLKQQYFDDHPLQKEDKEMADFLKDAKVNNSKFAGSSKECSNRECPNHCEKSEDVTLQQNDSNTNDKRKGRQKQKGANNQKQGTSSNTSKYVLRSWSKAEPNLEIACFPQEPKSMEGSSSNVQKISDSLAEMSLSESDSDSEEAKRKVKKSPVAKDRAALREDIKAFILQKEKERNPQPASVRPKEAVKPKSNGIESEDINELLTRLKFRDNTKPSDVSPKKNSLQDASKEVQLPLPEGKVSEKRKVNELEVTDCIEDELDKLISVYYVAVSKVICSESKRLIKGLDDISTQIVKPKISPVKTKEEILSPSHNFVHDDEYFAMGPKDFAKVFEKVACAECNAVNTLKISTQQDANCKFTKTMIVECLNCNNFVSETPTDSVVVVSDGQEEKNVSKLALRFAENVVDSGLRYSEALEKLKQASIPALTVLEFETLFQDLQCWYQMKCDNMKALATEKVRQHYTECGYKPDGDQMNITVFFDGVEMVRRKFFLTAHWFVVEVETGVVIDFEVLCRTCKECKRFWASKQFRVTAKEADDFMVEHKSSCLRHDTKSIVEWNREITSKLFARSVERGFRYSVIISNKNYSKLGLLGAEPYGKDHPLIIESHIVHLRSQVYNDLKQALGFKRFGGDEEVFNSISFIADRYMESIEKAQKDYSTLRQWVMGSVFHHLSTDEKPLHRLCPDGPESWCNYKKDLANNITPGKDWHTDKEKFDPILNPKWAEKILHFLLKKLSNEELDRTTDPEPDSRKDLLLKINGVIYRSSFQLESIIKYASYSAILEFNSDKGLECK